MRYIKNEKAENLYKQIKPYEMALEHECPAKIKLILMLNHWINPWHAITDLSKVIPFKVRKQLEKETLDCLCG